MRRQSSRAIEPTVWYSPEVQSRKTSFDEELAKTILWSCANQLNILQVVTMSINFVHSEFSDAFSAELERERREFEIRDSERRRLRIRVYDTLAEQRVVWAKKNRYYAQELERLVSSLVLPGLRVFEVGCGLGDLLAALRPAQGIGIDISGRMIDFAKQRHPHLSFQVGDVERDELPQGPFEAIVLSDVIGHLADIQVAMERLRGLLAPNGRMIVTYYNFVWEPVLKAAESLGLKARWPDQNWLSMGDIENLLGLSGFEVIRRGTNILLPVNVPIVSPILNRVAANLPIVREGALVDYFVARAVSERVVAHPMPSVSVICPCKDERGNIRAAVARTPLMGPKTELIFVDGNSKDGTKEEIESIMTQYKGPLDLKFLPQGNGQGKGDAVRKGFAIAKNDILMILDSDLTVPPEDLPKFYQALVTGKGEFINGVRLVYPMEGEAMRFLNLMGNKFFSVALSWLLEQPIKDSLCGTKVLYKRDYDRITEHRAVFGDFDPFGDFDLLFGAARLNMKIIDLPVRYRARTYGDTKISRFRDGWLLLKMTAFAFRKLRMNT